MREAGAPSDAASISALMALLERFAYFLVSRRLEFDADALLDTVTHIVHRGFFARTARASLSRRPRPELGGGADSASGPPARGARSTR